MDQTKKLTLAELKAKSQELGTIEILKNLGGNEPVSEYCHNGYGKDFYIGPVPHA